ncbi:MAG: hypothetical protein HRT71_17360 [Flavobacteriales bacterium]|nr:hypothetical protein [Flavobacteriales bacterium]
MGYEESSSNSVIRYNYRHSSSLDEIDRINYGASEILADDFELPEGSVEDREYIEMGA